MTAPKFKVGDSVSLVGDVPCDPTDGWLVLAWEPSDVLVLPSEYRYTVVNPHGHKRRVWEHEIEPTK